MAAASTTLVVNLILGAGSIVALANALCVLALIPVPLLARRSPTIAAHLFNIAMLVVLSFTAHQRGGLASVTLGWFPVVVILVRLMLPARAAWGWAVMWSVAILPHAWLVTPSSWDPALGPPLAYATVRSLCCLAAFGAAGIYEHYRQVAMTALQDRNAELDAERHRAEEAVAVKGRFLAHMSHEIRTPLTAVIGMSELLEESELDPDQREYVEHIRRQGQALLHLVNDVMDYSKLEAGRLELDPQPFDLLDSLESILEGSSLEAARKGLWLSLKYDPRIGRVVRGDGFRVRQVIANLVSNAVKFTEAGGVILDVTSVDDDQVSIAVQDTGLGVAPDRLEAIFDEFVQAEESTTRQFGGTGLGLPISRRFAELMGGSLEARSTPGVGSCFTLTMPLPAVQTAGAPALDGLEVVVLDSCARRGAILLEELQRRSVRCELTGDVTSALFAVRARNPDVLIVCAPLDGGDPLELPGRLGDCATRLVLSATLGGPIGPEAASRAGYSAFLPAPLRLSSIERTLSDEGHRPVAAEEPHDEPLPPVRRQVLVAEDNRVNQMIATRILEGLGCDVTVVDDGVAAVSAVRQSRFGLVLMDWHMPHMDGLEAARRIRAYELEQALPRVPIVALTANALPEDRERCAAAGMDGYLTKPFGFQSLKVEIEHWFGRADAAEGGTRTSEEASNGGGPRSQ